MILASEMVLIIDELLGFDTHVPVYFVNFTDKVGPSRFGKAHSLFDGIHLIMSAIVFSNVNEKFVSANAGREKATVSDRFLKEVLSLSG